MRNTQKTNFIKIILVAAGMLIGITATISAQEPVPSSEDSMAVFEGFFVDEDPLTVTMTTDFKNFKRKRRQEEYQPAEMTIHVDESFKVSRPVRIKARGIYRRDNCTNPPIWLNIRHSDIEVDSLDEVVRMKLVVRCRDSRQYDNYVLREYLVYKIYNMLTPVSYRVRLLKMKIVDTGKKDDVNESWAFLMEPDTLMEMRLEGKMVRNDRLSMNVMNREMMDRMALFSYMVANGDYSITGRHNVRIVALQNPGDMPGFLVIPYDFDYTGLVNANYAVPGEQGQELGIEHVRERYYLGPCRSREVHQEVMDELASKKEEILAYIRNFEYLEEREREDMIDYLTSYFDEAERDDFINRKILPTCREY
jgi:hypothetical protein